MAATSYKIQLVNNTQKAYHFGVYQKFPNAPGLTSVVWQECGIPKLATDSITWSIQYGVAIIGWDEDGKKFVGKQILPAELGKAYKIVIVQGNIPTIADAESEDEIRVSDNEIKLKNNTTQQLHLGFAMDGKITAMRKSTEGGQTANFVVHPTYYVALYRNIHKGSMVDDDLEVGPLEVEFKNKYTKALVKCDDEAGTDVLSYQLVPNFSD